jgi:hypothetical protein
MESELILHIKNLKSALLFLPPTGEKGFEGLVGAILREITGVPFRLASSGSQFGIDGKSTYEEDAICFEAKRYDNTVPKNEVISKIAELSIAEAEIEIWVLGATSQISSQLADKARKLGAQIGIVVLILDWSEIDVPPLAVALAMGGERAEAFLKDNIKNEELNRNTIIALEAIKNSQDFATHADRIRAQCKEPSVGWTLSQKANTLWLNDAFSDRKQARVKLGQPLSPSDTGKFHPKQRKTLIDKLHSVITANSERNVICVLGGEGNGKSWIVAQSWLALAHKPVMIFMSPDDFIDAAGQNDIVELLISKLIKQTGDKDIATTRGRWRRRLGQWRDHRVINSPRLIVFIDGINQRPKSDWAHIIEKVDYELNQIGGHLIVTSRTPYFRDRIKSCLSINFNEIFVPEWTESERDEILNASGIKTSTLHRTVARSLLNPRILGIALELLDKTNITNTQELSVSRLLFEHMRMSERDASGAQPVCEFARRLQKHAKKIISRVKMKQQDDINIFEDDIGAVADGRFFQTVDDDPMRYSLKDDGLTLALGFAVIDLLRIAQRNKRDMDAELNTILEPIAALDDTANVILAALTVTVADESCDQDITATLVKGFVILQNPDQTKFLAFASLVRNRPQGFMTAAQMLSLDGGHQPNFDWIETALVEAGRNYCTWQVIANKVNFWLSLYSLSPERGTFLHSARDPQEKVQEEREKNRKKIKERLQALSTNERTILDNLSEENGNLNRLSRLALLLLAGKSLAPFAKSLLNWSFSNALNSDHNAPYKDFMHLVSLNLIDWSQTRAALLDASAPLCGADVSTTGKWALVNILRVTGHSEDAKEAQFLLDDLTKDQRRFTGWRRIEDYCAADPCDPESKLPENIVRTAKQYLTLDVNKLRLGMGQSAQDHFFVMARTGIVRFMPKDAIAKHREFAGDVLTRAGFPLRQGLFELRQHNALLTIKEARELIKKWDEVRNTGKTGDLTEKDAWVVSQYCLLLAFPFLTAMEQIEILMSTKENEGILLNLMELTKPLGEKEFETLLGSACADNSERKQYLLLLLGKYTAVQLSTNSRNHVATLFRSESERVRAQALGVIAQSDDEELLGQVASSDWKAKNPKTDDSDEAWYGSIALLKASAKGLIAHGEALNRISARLYGRAATMLDANAVLDIASRINASINQVAGLEGNLVAPDIEIQVDSAVPCDSNSIAVSERPSESKDIVEAIKQLFEGNEDFEQRQKRNYDAFIKFKANLTKAKAHDILDYLSLEEFATVVDMAEDLADQWYRLFMNIADVKLPAIHNFVLLLAHALGRKKQGKAAELFQRIKDSKPLVRFTFGKAGVQLDAMAIWHGVRRPVLDNLRFSRLDRAGTDHDLSLEVLAALLNGQQELLTAYIEEKLSKEEPAEISRAIMVAGYSDQSEFNYNILKRYESSAGLIASAQKAAKYAYERNIWARHWYDKMCQTDENTEFWCYSILFLKIVDGRFSAVNSTCIQKGNPILLFESTFIQELKNRISKWKKYREKKLFGLDAPASIFLNRMEVND